MAKQPTEKLPLDLRDRLDRLGAELFLHDGKITDVKFTASFIYDEPQRNMIVADSRLPLELLVEAVSKELDHLENNEHLTQVDDVVALLESFQEVISSETEINLAGIVTPEKENEYGTLVVAHTLGHGLIMLQPDADASEFDHC